MISIKDIKSDKTNIIRYINNLFNLINQNTFISNEIELNKKFQSIKSKYIKNVTSILNSISYNSDDRIPKINNQIKDLSFYIQNIVSIFNSNKSKIFLTDILQQLITNLEEKFSDLIKINDSEL